MATIYSSFRQQITQLKQGLNNGILEPDKNPAAIYAKTHEERNNSFLELFFQF